MEAKTKTEDEVELPDLDKLMENPSLDDIQLICKSLFDKWLAKGQCQIVDKIIFGGRRVVLLAPTRYGKSVSIGVSIALYIYLNPGCNVTIMANKSDTCDTIRSEFIDAAVNCPPLLDKLQSRSTDARKLSEEISKSKLQLSDGTEVIMQTAGENVGPDALDGIGGDLNILDESDNVPDRNFQKGVRRMLGESEDARLVQSGNATLRNQHFFKSWQDPDYEKVKVTWEQAVKERYGPNGSRPLTKDFVLKEQKDLPASHFKSMYMCEFPDEEQSGLLSYKYIRSAEDSEMLDDDLVDNPLVLYGLDPAREGRDNSVLTRVEKHGVFYVVTGQERFDIGDTRRLADKVVELIEDRDGDDYTRVNVDSHGIGAGVLDNLRREGVYATGVKVGVSGRKALNRPDDFQDLKAEFYDKVRKIFESEEIIFQGDYPVLSNELNDLETEKNNRNKIRVVDPSKSPDFADSLMLALSVDKPRKTGGSGSTKAF